MTNIVSAIVRISTAALQRKISARCTTGSMLVAAVLLGCHSISYAQSVWEVTPYSVRVIWAVGDEPDIPNSWHDDFPIRLEDDLKVIFRATWDTKVELAPPSLRAALLQRMDELSAEDLHRANAEWKKVEKLYLVGISGSRAGYSIRVREFDGTLSHFGPTDLDQVDVLSQVSSRTAQLLTEAFSPLVRIDRYADGKAKTRLRAGALMGDMTNVGSLEVGDVLLPFDRRVSSSGNTKPTDIRPIDWTYLVVQEKPTSSVTNLDVVSGYKQPFRTKRNRRNQQLALRARRTGTSSTIRLQSRSKTPQPLIGYEIHERGPESTTNFLGHTNWRGELKIPVGSTPIRTLLVRSGDRVTAKLPIVPGLRDVVVAAMLDDRQRVETDGFLAGIQTALVDLVAKRESLSARIRKLIAGGEFDEARLLLNEFRDLPTQADFQSEIQRQQRTLRITDSRLQKRIDTMFVQTFRTLGKYLDSGRQRELEAELEAAKNQ